MDIKYLVFSGGGAAGYGHGGAIIGLSEQPEFSFNNIKGVAGASIGALAALMVSLKYSPEEIANKLTNFNIKAIKEERCVARKLFRLFNHYGYYKSDVIYKMISSLLKEKTRAINPENVTFIDLKNLGCIDLYIVTTKIYKENETPIGKEKIFSPDKTPDTSVIAAMLASMAEPGYFQQVRLKKINKGKFILNNDGDLFGDGGIVNNFPIDIFDKPKFMPMDPEISVNPNTLGLALLYESKIDDETHHIIKTPLKDSHPLEFTEGLINALQLRNKKANLEKSENRKRTVQIDRLGISASDFDISDKVKRALVESGRQAVNRYFAAHRNKLKPTDHIEPVVSQSSTLWRKKPSLYQDEIFSEGETNTLANLKILTR